MTEVSREKLSFISPEYFLPRLVGEYIQAKKILGLSKKSR